MRLTNFFVHTLREAPAEAEVASHVLMLRAGMIKKTAAGIYSYLPMGLRVIRKIENIVRECMNDAGALELLMPAIQPAEMWQESGRWQQYGAELLRLKDRHGRDFVVGPTHEEVITDIVRGSVNSYKQMPFTLYQIQTKFRDERRPRFGLMRGREFIMKDAYSFDTSDENSQKSYEKMRQAYNNIFTRCGLTYRMVDADSGSIGGSYSNEFMVLANTGEDVIISCEKCNYSANLEKAVALKAAPIDAEEETLQEIHTPGAHTVEEVSAFLKKSPEQIIKTLIVKVDDSFAAVLVRGDHEANLIKLKNHLNAATVELAGPEDILNITGAPVGFAGPVNLKIPVYADLAIEDMKSAVTGANKKERHFTGVMPGRNFKATAYLDLREALAGDKCPHCGGTYEIARGIEVGHIFKLGTKYSESMQAKFLDANGKQQFMVMGSYGIGIGRVAAAAIEQNHDENGIIWPLPIAPFEVAVMALNTNEPEIVNLAETFYLEFKKLGVDVLIDDRDERAGVKLKDADLIGYPVRVVIGKKSISDNLVEVTVRRENEPKSIPRDQIIPYVMEKLGELKGKS